MKVPDSSKLKSDRSSSTASAGIKRISSILNIFQYLATFLIVSQSPSTDRSRYVTIPVYVPNIFDSLEMAAYK